MPGYSSLTFCHGSAWIASVCCYLASMLNASKMNTLSIKADIERGLRRSDATSVF
jgi:hypothetical protein